MDYSTILSAIKTKVTTASGCSNVYDYERWAANWATILALFKTSGGLIHAWMISRVSTHRQAQSIGAAERAHVFRIRGVYGLDDSAATEKTFQGIANTVAEAFDADLTLSGACLTLAPDWGPMANQVGLQINDVDIRAFGNILCHHADCRLCATESPNY